MINSKFVSFKTLAITQTDIFFKILKTVNLEASISSLERVMLLNRTILQFLLVAVAQNYFFLVF